ncbi:hypothetical protein KIL84_012362 [Mauremys mutica]|uniref:Uncharacterized protein n=1 Tax=Mauremys mutica TaxID=74926 RepID=A0A9D3XGD8_9SAUR|nr:hypothetical protein KIL84_012362 [Mauremys mutica]
MLAMGTDCRCEGARDILQPYLLSILLLLSGNRVFSGASSSGCYGTLQTAPPPKAWQFERGTPRGQLLLLPPNSHSNYGGDNSDTFLTETGRKPQSSSLKT